MDAHRQTRIAVAARKLGLIHADLAVALSLTLTLTLTHKAITFDRRMPDIDYDALTLASTETLPVAVPGAIRADGARNKQQPRQPTPRRIPPPPGVEPVTRNRVQRRRHGDRADHHRDPPTDRPRLRAGTPPSTGTPATPLLERP